MKARIILFFSLCFFYNVLAQNWQVVGEYLTDNPFNFDEEIELYEFNQKLYAGGVLRRINDVVVKSVAYYDGQRWYAMEFEEEVPYQVNNFTTFRGQLYAIAEYHNDNLVMTHLIVLDPESNRWKKVPRSNLTTSFEGSGGYIKDMIEYKNELYIIGQFRYIDSNPIQNIARWGGNQWRKVTGAGGRELYTFEFHRMHVFNGELYITGRSMRIGEDFIDLENIVKYDGVDWTRLGKGLTPPFGSFSTGTIVMTDFRGKLYAAGSRGLATDPMLTGYSLYLWNGEAWEGVLGFDLTSLEVGYVKALKVFGDNLYISSQWGIIHTYNGTEITELSEQLPILIKSLTVFKNELYCSGRFGYGIDDLLEGIFRLSSKIDENRVSTEVNVFPNPNRGSFNLSYRILGTEDTMIEFFDVNGKLVFREIYQEESGLHLKTLNFEEHAPGIYFLKIKNNEFETTQKVVIAE